MQFLRAILQGLILGHLMCYRLTWRSEFGPWKGQLLLMGSLRLIGNASVSILCFSVWRQGWTVEIWTLAPRVSENYRRLSRDRQAIGLTGEEQASTWMWYCLLGVCLRAILGTR
jgi:hypothetical protein